MAERREVAKQMARHVAITERNRAKGPPGRAQTVGDVLEDVIGFADEFPPAPKEELRYPILKRLFANAGRRP